MTFASPAASAARSCLFLLLLAVCLQWPVSGARAADRDRIEAFLEVTGFDVALDSIASSASAAPQMLGLEAEQFGADAATPLPQFGGGDIEDADAVGPPPALPVRQEELGVESPRDAGGLDDLDGLGWHEGRV